MHVLIVCYTFPPSRGIGGRRWAKFAKGLATAGHRVDVVQASPMTSGPVSQWIRDVDHPAISRHELPRRYPEVLARRPLLRTWDKVMYRTWVAVMPFLVKGNPLDGSVFWRRQLRATIRTLREKHDIRHVIVSGAPFRLMAFASELREEDPTMHLTLDFRDPWTWGDAYGMRSLPPRRLRQEQAWERKAVARADLVLAPAQAMVDHLRTTYPEQASQVHLLPHAVDPDELVPSPSLPQPRRSGIGLIYAGSTYDSAAFRSYLARVITAFQAARDVQARFELFISGDGVEEYQRMVRSAGQEGRIVVSGPLAMKDLAPRLRAADAVLLYTPPSKKDILTTKFSELLHLRVPIVHVGDEGGVSEHITRHGLGLSLREGEVAERLPVLLAGGEPVPYAPTIDADDLLLPRLTEQLVRSLQGGAADR